jgi:hypothetical protein
VKGVSVFAMCLTVFVCLLSLVAVPAVAKGQQLQCANGVCRVVSEATVVTRVQTVSIADMYGIELAPGETLVSIDGVSVEQFNVRSTGPIRNAIAGVTNATAQVMRSISNAFIVNRDERAYRHALREAQILANRRSAGHPLGVAPGCRFSGTGISLSADRPNHCYLNLPNARLVARAMVVGNDGRFYWSAHYR